MSSILGYVKSDKRGVREGNERNVKNRVMISNTVSMAARLYQEQKQSGRASPRSLAFELEGKEND